MAYLSPGTVDGFQRTEQDLMNEFEAVCRTVAVRCSAERMDPTPEGMAYVAKMEAIRDAMIPCAPLTEVKNPCVIAVLDGKALVDSGAGDGTVVEDPNTPLTVQMYLLPTDEAGLNAAEVAIATARDALRASVDEFLALDRHQREPAAANPVPQIVSARHAPRLAVAGGATAAAQ